MRTWAEGVLAIVVVVVLGAAFFLLSGASLDAESTESAPPITIDSGAAARGELLANGTGCLACHTIDGTPGSGSTWKGLAGSSRPLQTGEVVLADDIYLRNSIVAPGSQVVVGFENIMPADYGEQLTDEEIGDLVEYIKSLS